MPEAGAAPACLSLEGLRLGSPGCSFYRALLALGVAAGSSRNQTPPAQAFVSYGLRPRLWLPSPGCTPLGVMQPVMTELRAIQFSRCGCG